MMLVLKDKKGRARWVTYSSNAFRDADREIVSMKALQADCDRADKDGMYGPLRWWHVPGAELGWCDFNAVVGKTLIESGTFKDDRLADVLAKSDYQISIGFKHPIDQPDGNGVFHRILRFERSVVPAGRVANRFTKFLTITKESKMATLQEKLTALKQVFGDDALVETILTGARQAEKEAEAQGIEWKELDEAETEKAKGKKKVKPPVAEEEVMEEEDTLEEETAETKEDDWSDVPVIGDMPLDNFASMLAESVDAGLEPILKELHTLKAWQESTEAGIQRTAQALKERKSQDFEKFTELVNGLEGRVKELETELTDAREALKELIGDQPNSSYRASEANDNIIGENHRLKGAEPAPDPLAPFFDFVTGSN